MKKVLCILLPILLVLVLLGGAAWYFLFYQADQTAGYFLERGDHAMQDGRYERAVQMYTKAYALDPEDYTTAISLSKAYAAASNYTKAEFTLVNAIADHADVADLYRALSSIYVAQDKLLDAQQMLDSIANEAVKTELDAQRPATPAISPESGYYTDYIDVTLSYSDGIAYLRTDGEYPSTADAPYSGPVTLPSGESTVCAIAVGDDGLVSGVAYCGYTVGNIVEPAEFASPAFETFIREQLELSAADTIMTDDLWSVTELVVPDTITDVTDLSYFTGLTSLTLQNYHGGDFTFLSGMTCLQSLDLSSSSVSAQALSLIGNLSTLQTLVLDGCGITDISALASLAQLQTLALPNNRVADLTPLVSMTALTSLDLSTNEITDLSVFRSLTQLKSLNLAYNTPASIAPLSSCTMLESIDLSNCSLTDLSALASCTSLIQLTAAHNELEGIAGLQACTALEEVDLSYNKLTSIDELGSIDSIFYININENDVVNVPKFSSNSRLQKFYADHNFLEDLTGLSTLPYLNYVTLDYNNITNIDCLADCVNLVQVNVFHTNIDSADKVSALTDRSIIVNYTPSF